jgi:hypothetical protein
MSPFGIQVPRATSFGKLAEAVAGLVRPLVAAAAPQAQRGVLVRALKEIRFYVDKALELLDERGVEDARASGDVPRAGGALIFAIPAQERRRILYLVRAADKEDADFKLRAFATAGAYPGDVHVRGIAGDVRLSSPDIEEPIDVLCGVCRLSTIKYAVNGVHRCKRRKR